MGDQHTMGRILFVTVGTSAITNHELWDTNGDLPPDLPQDGNWGELIRGAEAACVKDMFHNRKVEWKTVAKKVEAVFTPFEEALTDLHRKFWGKTNHHKREHRRRTTAETISTWLAGAAHRMDGGQLQANEDKVVLVVSRTCIGQMAGRINQALFREHLFEGEGERKVVIETVDDLRLEGIHEEAGEAASLSEQMRRIFDGHAGSQCRTPIFNITGGFKGLIPAITVICREGGRTMLYLHESMDGTVRLRFENGKLQEEYESCHVNVEH